MAWSRSMEIQASRAGARVGPSGEPILLLDQNRARWDQLLIRRGLAALVRRVPKLSWDWRRRGPYAAAGRDRRLSRASADRGGDGLGSASSRSTLSSPSSRHHPLWS